MKKMEKIPNVWDKIYGDIWNYIYLFSTNKNNILINTEYCLEHIQLNKLTNMWKKISK